MSFLGVVLAGGRSSRMGSDKALLAWQDSTLLDHAVALLEAAGASRVLVSGRTDHPYGFADRLLHAGPPGALYSLLLHLQEEGTLDDRKLLLIPVDMPLLQAGTLTTLVESCSKGTALHYAGEVFPCVLPASPALLQHLQTLYRGTTEKGGARSMKSLFGWLQAGKLEPSPHMPREFTNVNTPEDWQALLP